MTRSNLDPLDPQIAAAADSSPHRAADDREEIYFEGSPLIRGELGKMITAVVIGLAFILAPVIYWYLKDQTDWWPWWVNLTLVVIGLLVILIPFILVRRVRYRISNYRIDYERGLMSKSIDTLELWHVDDIKFHQSFFDRMFGVGDITVISHDDTTPLLKLNGLPKPRPLFENLKQRVIAVKRQRGVIKMDVG